MAHCTHFVFIFLNFLLFLDSRGLWACEVTAQTEAGPVCGTVIQQRLAVFQRVPYAEQPVGKLRFKELQPLKPWQGVLDATKSGPVCPQVDYVYLSLLNTTYMDEACVYANIHTPISAVPSCDLEVKSKSGLPVLVFVHGGAFQVGSGNPDLYGPEYFVDKDVVMITFNYRLNVFGFMSLNTTDIPGNQGLRDILQLLRWVRDNVHYFGGDPDNVTLMGQSAGSSAAHLIALSPTSKGLLKRGLWACEVTAQTEAGPVCGTVIQQRLAVFQRVPYAEQPVGKLRFKELQPLRPWKGVLDATKSGPVCPQVDHVYLSLLNTTYMDEACIYANIHTPISAVPSCDLDVKSKSGLPVLVFVHGGSFEAGSGNPDFFGPEYFVDKDVVMITFNYRLNVFGFMSLNTADIPGNQGLRDILHLLRWVRDNVHYFGGDPDNVTLMGQSAGSSAAHLIALSPTSKGLLKRLILSSGTALPSFFSTSPRYAQQVSNMLLNELGINTNDTDAAFKKLIDLPLSTILNANDIVQNATGVVAFVPVIETQFDGVTTIVTEDPAVLTKNGALDDVPVLLGFNTTECRYFEKRIEGLNFIEVLKKTPSLLLSPKLLLSSSNETLAFLAGEVQKRYFDGEINYDGFMNLCGDTFFIYPALKMAQIRAESGSADTFLYQFSYEGEFRSPLEALNLSKFDGVCHMEDLTYLFRTNSVLNNRTPLVTPTDDRMRASWLDTIINFMTCSRPDCSKDSNSWRAVQAKKLAYQNIKSPGDFRPTPISEDRQKMIEFFDDIGLLF